MNEVVLGTLFGILMGPHCAGVFNPRAWGVHSDAITIEITRIVLATGLFAIGVELPKSYMAKHAKSLLKMVVPTMAIGWVIVAGMSLHVLHYIQLIFSRSFACNLSQVELHLLFGGGSLPYPNGPYYMRCNCWYVRA